MVKIELRLQKISDAKKYFEILNNPNFIYFDVRPASVEAEKEWLKNAVKKREQHFMYNYAIIADGELAGGCGIKIDQHRKYIGEIGYFIDEVHWNRGLATNAVELLERIGFSDMDLKRIEILMDVRNSASEKVAIKSGYKKEGVMKKAILSSGELKDCYLYAKVK